MGPTALRVVFDQLCEADLRDMLHARLPPTGDETELDDSGSTRLVHRAAERGDLQLLAACLAADPSLVHLEGSFDRQPLHYAARGTQLAAVEALLAAGASASALDGWSSTAAFHVAYHCGPELSAQEHTAVDGILTRLVAAGMDINIFDDHEDTALYRAVENREMGLARLLLKHGARCGLAEQADAKILSSVVGWVSYSVCGEDCIRLLQELIERGAAVNARDEDGCTALLEAAGLAPRLPLELVAPLLELLLTHGADATARDSKGRNCFHYLMSRLEMKGCKPAAVREALRVLLPVAGGQEALNALCQEHQEPPIFGIKNLLRQNTHYGHDWNDADMSGCVREMLEAGANLHAPSGRHRTLAERVLVQAVRKDEGTHARGMRVLRVLLDAGMDINAVDQHGCNLLARLLHYMSYDTDENSFEMKEEEMRNPQLWAVLEALLEWGSSPNLYRRCPEIYQQQRTVEPGNRWHREGLVSSPLKSAVLMGSARLVRQLAAAGADALQGDETGRPLLLVLWEDLLLTVRFYAGYLAHSETEAVPADAIAHLGSFLDLASALREAGAPSISYQEAEKCQGHIVDGVYNALRTRYKLTSTYKNLGVAKSVLTDWQWSKDRHSEAPKLLHEAARTLLLINRYRGFPAAGQAVAGAGLAAAGAVVDGRADGKEGQAGESSLAEEDAGGRRVRQRIDEASRWASSTPMIGPVTAAREGVVLAPDVACGSVRKQKQERYQAKRAQQRVSLQPELVLRIISLAGADLAPWLMADMAGWVAPWTQPSQRRSWLGW